ncbi:MULTISPECIES: hypothetical protein [unclassified Corynebacterium]|nr:MULTISPECIES: hypothetical protein [unclassified Corynebacterium]
MDISFNSHARQLLQPLLIPSLINPVISPSRTADSLRSTTAYLNLQIGDSIRAHNDHVDALNAFLRRCENLDTDLALELDHD